MTPRGFRAFWSTAPKSLWVLIPAIIGILVFLVLWEEALRYSAGTTEEGAQGDFVTYKISAVLMMAGKIVYEIGKWLSQVNFRYHPVTLLLFFLIPNMLVMILLNMTCYISAMVLQIRLFMRDKRLFAAAFAMMFYTFWNSTQLANVSFGNINALLQLPDVIGILLIANCLEKDKYKGLGVWIGILSLLPMLTKPQWLIAFCVLVTAGFIKGMVEGDWRLFFQGGIAFVVGVSLYTLITLAFVTFFPRGDIYFSEYITFMRGSHSNYPWELYYPSDQNGIEQVMTLIAHKWTPLIGNLALAFKLSLFAMFGVTVSTLIKMKVKITIFLLFFLAGMIYLIGMNSVLEFQELVWLPMPYLVAWVAVSKRHKLFLTIMMLIWGGTSLFNFPGAMIYGYNEVMVSTMENILFFNRLFPLELVCGLIVLGYLYLLPVLWSAVFEKHQIAKPQLNAVPMAT